MRCTTRILWPLLAISLLLSAAAQAAQKRAFREGRFEQGELKYINDLPVLLVRGTPEEMGRQKAALTGEAVKALADYPRRLLSALGREDRWPKLAAAGEALMQQAPADHRAELRVFGQATGIDRQTGIVANTIMDTYRGFLGCSSLAVSAEKSTTHGPLLGRNLDFFTLGVLDKYGLVTVHCPRGKHAFASVGLPGVIGCLSGMNDAGLALAVHQVRRAADGSPMLDPQGMPYTLCFRRMLEECTTIEEAEKLLRSVPRSTRLSVDVCDRHGAAVLEMTPKTVVLRRGSDGICVSTNHFRSKELSVGTTCPRYIVLSRAAAMEKISPADLARKLDAVNQGPLTMQTMIFEPAELLLHLSLGPCPASSQPLKDLPLRELLGGG